MKTLQLQKACNTNNTYNADNNNNNNILLTDR